MIVTPQQFGAIGDGIADDLPALNAAIAALLAPPYYQGGTIDLGSKIYRVTDTWVVGTKFIDAEDCFEGNITVRKPASYNEAEYIKSIGKNPVKIISSGGGIYGDFTPTKLTPIIYYNLYGDTRAWRSTEKYISEITNVGVYGKGALVNGVPTLKPNSVGHNYLNNQLGILCLYTLQMKINNPTFYGVQEGLLMNSCYFSTIRSPYFKLNNRGLYHVQSHGSLIENPTAYYCNKAYEIRSSQIVMNNINTENCPISLHILNGNNTVNGCYLESGGNAGEGQLIIGEDGGHDCDGITISALTIATSLCPNDRKTLINRSSSSPFSAFLFSRSCKSSFHMICSTSSMLPPV